MTPTKSTTKKEKEVKPQVKPSRYFEAKGGRKSSVARVRLFTKKGDNMVNDKSFDRYFSQPKHQAISASPLKLMNTEETMSFSAKIYGGGVSSQADALRNALAKALLLFNPEFRKRLRKAGYLTRDAREVERKKAGLKKARKAPQWAKR